MREADLLAMVDARFTPKAKPGYPQRFMIGHHVQPPISAAARKHNRIADAIVLDRNSSYPVRPVSDGPDRWGRIGGPDYTRLYMAVHGFEVKVTRSDWLRELADPTKADEWARYCHHWWLVAPREVVKPGELPGGWGHLAPAGQRLRMVTEAPLRQPLPMPAPVVVAINWAVLKHSRKQKT